MTLLILCGNLGMLMTPRKKTFMFSSENIRTVKSMGNTKDELCKAKSRRFSPSHFMRPGEIGMAMVMTMEIVILLDVICNSFTSL